MADANDDYLEARIEGAKTLAESYEHYQSRPECFLAGVQYALDHMLNRTVGVLEPYDQFLIASALEILTNAKNGRL